MARVPYVDPEQTSGTLRQLYRGVESLYGRVVHLWRILGHSPQVMKYMAPLSVAIQRKGYMALDQDLKRLAIIRTSWINECNYCVSHNVDFALAQGMDEQKVASLQQEQLDEDLFTEEELVVLAWAEAVTHNTARRDMAAFEALGRFFSTQEIVELTVAVAHRNMINRIQEALWTDLEPEDFPSSGLHRGGDDTDPLEQWIAAVHPG